MKQHFYHGCLRWIRFGVSLGLVGAAHGAVIKLERAQQLPPAANRAVDFDQDIAPIFTTACLSCHGPDKQKHGFRLDVKDAALNGGDSGPAIVPGKSAESLLIHLVSGLVDDLVMPQKGNRLTAEQIGLLRAWIDQGANWPENVSAAKPDPRLKYWAFQPVVCPALPTVANQRWASKPLDRFILARLEKEKLTPSPAADRATLIRRLTFDLHGLPPTSAEVDAFLADKSSDAVAHVVDRLLASPRYGERWARHWLDVARFCESNGFERDQLREHSWRYRDYVIASLNADKPYTQFVREQIAGDVLEPVTREGVIATSFLVAGPNDEAGKGSVSALLRARIREEELEDMIAVVSQTFMGVTVNCARCHDHKFDPIPQRDYYRLKAAITGVHPGDRSVLTPAETKARETQIAQLNGRITEMEKQVAAIEQAAREKVLHARGTTVSDGAPTPLAQWTFDGDTKDSLGSLHGTLHGGAAVAKGRLKLNGKSAFLQTEPLAREIREKTLEAWVVLSNLKQQGGGVITLESKGGVVFDSIVFGERTAGKWFAGSDGYQRSRDLNAPDETAPPGELVHIAIVYRADNHITCYRNGVPYGETYVPAGENGTLRSYPAKESRVLLGWRHTGSGNSFLTGEIEEARLYDRALSAEEIALSARSGGTRLVTASEMLNALTSEQRQQREALFAELIRHREMLKTVPPVPLVYGANSRPPELTFVLARGDVEKKKEPVTAGALSAVAALPADFGLPADAPEGQRRVKLADWLASANNPLTARVMVNRVWHYHFGRGLVGTPNDLGAAGERPSHPELLDWLAGEFMAQGWSLKKLHRLILLSNAYQQASLANEKATARDADNRLLWRFPPRRLEAEAVRDAMLSVSGQLNDQFGGPSFRPFDMKIANSSFYTLTDPIGPDFNRRTVYRIGVQSAKDPLLDSFDCPDFSTKTPVRGITTTPLQALSLMNNSFVLRQARHFAERLKTEAGADVTAQINLAYRLAFGRAPTSGESQRAAVLARSQGVESVCWVLLNASEFLYVR